MRQRRRVYRRRVRKTYQAGVMRRRIGGHARRMARALGALSAVPDREPRCRLSETALIINYGCASNPLWCWRGIRWLNHPHAVAISSNKLDAFRAFDEHDVPTLAWTTNPTEAKKWLDDGRNVFARTVLRGSRGDGIVLAEPGRLSMDGTSRHTLQRAPLYTRNFPKTHEFRVHVAGGRVIDVVEKKARNGMEPDRTVRNHAGGWIFAHDALSTDPAGLADICVRAVAACHLNFGAVDVLACLGPSTGRSNYRKLKKAVVCEVNSSPAWECTETFNAYRRYFSNEIANRSRSM